MPKKAILSVLTFITIFISACSTIPLTSSPLSGSTISTTLIQQQTGNTNLTKPTYPAVITGKVTVVNNLVYGTIVPKRTYPLLGQDRVLWIIEVNVQNNNYEQPVNATWEQDKSIPMPTGVTPNIVWSTIIGGTRWAGLDLGLPPASMSVAKGKSGKTTFSFEAPKNVNPNDAQICYCGQEPYSFGQLSLQGYANTYDWDTKTVIAGTPAISTTQALEPYVIFKGFIIGSITTNLKTVQNWNGNSNKTVDFNLTKSPGVINYTSVATSKISSNIEIAVQGGNGNPPIGSQYWTIIMANGTILEGTGNYRLRITSSGCNWTARVQ